MSGLEYPVMRTAVDIEKAPYAVSIPNVVVTLPRAGELVRIARGDPLTWLMPAPKTVRLAQR
jgi:hypothetical protein